MGRWSRLVAERFVAWLDLPANGSFLDVGCGTGALTRAVLTSAGSGRVLGLDPSPALVRHAAGLLGGPRVSFCVGSADALPLAPASVEGVVSGLVLNFVGDPEVAVRHMRRVTRSGGLVAAYVWDYSDGMQLLKTFWETAAELDAAAQDLDEGGQFTLCRPDALLALFAGAGLSDVDVRPIDVATTFKDFDDYWAPFLGGRAPAPAYVMSLSEERRSALREALRARLPAEDDGRLPLTARAWAVRGSV